MTARLLVLIALLLPLGQGAASADSLRHPVPAWHQAVEAADAIDHIVVVVLENSTFDHMFGTYPGADGLDPRRDRLVDSSGRFIGPRPLRAEDLGRVGTFQVESGQEALSNSVRAAHAAYADGAMDGFLRAQATRGGYEDLVLRYFERSHYPYLWALADEGVLFDRYYSSFLGDSLPNILHLISGDNAGIHIGTRTTLRELWNSQMPTVFDHAREAGVSWGYYIGGLDGLDREKLHSGGYFSEHAEGAPSQLYWAPVLAMQRFWTDPELRAGVHDQDEFYEDAAAGTMPQITYILPSPNTHWPTPPEQSELRLVSLVDAVRKSPHWDRTAMLFVWDDYGGFYDHVAPPQVHSDGLGFRVPAIMVSPRVQGGQISSVPHDHTSVPAFIADTFDLPAVGHRYTAGSFRGIWREQAPSERTLLSADRTEPYEAYGGHHAGLVYRAYTVLLGLTAIIVVLLLIAGWRSGPRRRAVAGRASARSPSRQTDVRLEVPTRAPVRRAPRPVPAMHHRRRQTSSRREG